MGETTKSFKVKINEQKKVLDFCRICSKYDADIDVQHGRHNVDGKSVLGIFSLSLSNVLNVNANFKNEEDVEKFEKEIKAYIVEK